LKVIDRYPLNDRPNCSLPEGCRLFCFPKGYYMIKDTPADRKKTRFHSFVFTDEHGGRTIGCCLTFYSPITAAQKETFLSIVEKIDGIKDANLMKEENLLIPRCLCLLSHWPFVSSFKRFLCGIYSMALNGSTIPIERYICNFLDEVPSPPAGRVDITYYLGEKSISFRCPPSNQPNVWSGLPLFPLFECLSPENILELFGLLLTERQILFISSQFSLLTSCAEAITSLIYPLSWAHAYAPILPLQYLGMLDAIVPFVLGIHSSFLSLPECCISNETVCVYLDENRIEYGDLGESPSLPERRCKKLLQYIAEAAVFDNRGKDWETSRLPFFDDGFSNGTDHPNIVHIGGKFDESAMRDAFLKFFVAIFKDYRRFLIFGNPKDTSEQHHRFRFDEFLNEQPADWEPFLRAMQDTQTFQQFVDERVLSTSRYEDIVFFDESIDAKMNRYTFKLRNIDTPFLLDNGTRHTKTYVPPTANTTNLPEVKKLYKYSTFPKLDVSLFSEARKLEVTFDTGNILQLNRLKRKGLIPGQTPSTQPMSSIAATYSCYLVTISYVICNGLLAKGVVSRRGSLRSTKEVLEEYKNSPESLEKRRSRSASTASSASYDTHTIQKALEKDMEDSDDNNNDNTVFKLDALKETLSSTNAEMNTEAAVLGLKIALEVLNCLGRLDECPDDLVYRSLADACAACGFSSEVVDLLVHMNDEGLLPDNMMLNDVARAFAQDNRNKSSSGSSHKRFDPADVWTIQDWKSMQKGSGSLYRRRQNPLSSSKKETPSSSGWESLLFGTDSSVEVSPSKKTPVRDATTSKLPFANLEWSNFGSQKIFAASAKLNRHMTVCEGMLSSNFPDLSINLSHQYGTVCPGAKCTLKRPLTISEIYQGFEPPDANKYTTRCFECGIEFVPRFCVDCSREDWQGSEGPGTTLWCELLSPWTLRKEVFHILFQDGVDSLISKSFRNSSTQHAVIFWNIIIAFRICGLPYSFLLSNRSLVVAFPSKPSSGGTGSSSSSKECKETSSALQSPDLSSK